MGPLVSTYSRLGRRVSPNHGRISLLSLVSSFSGSDCNCFAFEWRFKRATEAIAYMETPPRAYGLMETLSEFAAHDKLDEAVMILHAIAAKSSDEMQWAYREEHLKPLLKHAFASRNRVTVLLAESIQERLLSAGLFEYLDLRPEEEIEEGASV